MVDADGDLPFPCGTAMSYVSVVRFGRLLRVWSRAVSGIDVDKPVLREIGRTADRLGSMLAAVHGGRVAFPEAAEADHECEE